jgi:hypothetical protein
MVMEGGEAMDTGLKAVSRKSFVQRFFSADYIDVPANAQILKLLSKQGRFFLVGLFCFVLFFPSLFSFAIFLSFSFFGASFEHKQRCPLSPSVYSILFPWHN